MIRISNEINGTKQVKFIDEKDLGYFQLYGWKIDNTPSEPHAVKKGKKRED